MTRPDPPKNLGRLDRRSALRWFTAAAAAAGAGASVPLRLTAQQESLTEGFLESPPSQPAGTLADPNLLDPKVPWERVLSETELQTAAVLSDVILPSGGGSPAASEAHVPDFIDEWVSAPFPVQLADREVIRGGLAWINTEAYRRFEAPFSGLSLEQQFAICDDIAHVPAAAPEFRFGAQFFNRFRELAATGYYTSNAGWQDLGYAGNIPLPRFDGPPREVLHHLGLEED
ncbi:MAG TPA: gluconate 2-dehydrogenase subunit 3 family protein [Verrucomicrobiales bacterium]|nr:gluconate 2-dehydrogenase subunit 3 family protein [Verrucomicrobiales bacterium]